MSSSLARRVRVEDLRRLLGLAEPAPSRSRGAIAAVAPIGLLGLTIVGADVGNLGSGGGRLFIVFAVTVGPLVAWLLVLRPWTGLMLWAAMMALLNVPRVEWWLGPIQVIESTVFVGALGAGVAFNRARQKVVPTAGRRPGRASRSALVTIGLIASTLLSLAASPSPVPGIPIVLHGAIEPILVAYFLIALVPTRRQVLGLGGAMALGLALASLYSVLRIGRVATTISGLEAVRVQLAHFTFYNVGIYGDALAMTIPLALAGVLWWRIAGNRRSVLVALSLGLMILLAGLYLTFSKSAWLGSAVAILLVILARFRRRWQLGALIAASALALSLFVPYPLYILRAAHIDLPATNPYVQLVTTVSGGRLTSWDVGSPEGEVSISERWRATQAAGRMVLDHPVVGVGPGRFGDEYAARYADPSATRLLGSPHNLFPEVAAELGLPAALLLLLGLLAAALAAWRSVRSQDALRQALGAGFGAALVAFMVVTATFGLDLYRDYRVMNADVVMAGLIVGACLSLSAGLGRLPGRPESIAAE